MKTVGVVLHDDTLATHRFLVGGSAGGYSAGYSEFYKLLCLNPYNAFQFRRTHFLREDFTGCYGSSLVVGDTGFRAVWSLLNRTYESDESWFSHVCGDVPESILDDLKAVEEPIVVCILHSAINYHRPIAEGNDKRNHDYRFFMDWWSHGGATGKLKDSVDDWESYGSLVREWGRTE